MSGKNKANQNLSQKNDTIKVAHILNLNTNCNFQATDDFTCIF